jgi:sugar lactone lactonase YvrE
MSTSLQAQQLTDPITVHGEGPVWFEETGELRLVDMLAGDLLSMASDGSITRRHVGDVAAALRPRAAGGFVVAVEHGFALDAGDGSPLRPLPEILTDPGLRMNEGGCDPDGRFYCGSMAYDQALGAGALYRLDTDGSVATVITGCTISNGLDWSPNGEFAYYVDTPTQRIDVFDYDPSGELSGRRPFVTIEEADGSPDGLTVDAEGGVWVALWGGAQVRRYSAEGRLDAVIGVPATQVTACTFGGPKLDQLFITTSRLDLSAEDEPLAGAVFSVDAGVEGLPARRYRG